MSDSEPSEPRVDEQRRTDDEQLGSIPVNPEICDDPTCCCEPEPRWQRVAEEMEEERRRRERQSKPESSRGG